MEHVAWHPRRKLGVNESGHLRDPIPTERDLHRLRSDWTPGRGSPEGEGIMAFSRRALAAAAASWLLAPALAGAAPVIEVTIDGVAAGSPLVQQDAVVGVGRTAAVKANDRALVRRLIRPGDGDRSVIVVQDRTCGRVVGERGVDG